MATAMTLAGLDELQAQVRGDVISAEDARYDEARQVHNGMIDKNPAVIVRCRDTADVAAALAYARGQGLDVAIRGGGHNAAGLGSVDGGLVIDLSLLRWIRVDPKTQTVVAGGGCTLGDVDHATHAYGLAVPLGVLSTTGIAGLTLGGGIGHLTRKYGLSIDNLIGADVVLADGSFVHASEDENQDLFWALRGGGGNFGVVTAFTYKAHPVSTVIAGPTLWPIERSAEILAWYRDFIGTAPDDLSGFAAFLTVPPGPPFPEELHLQKMCAVVWCFTGPVEDADELFRPVRELKPAMDGVGAVPFPAIQAAFDPLYPPGLQLYWKADFVDELSDDAIAAHVEHGSRLPTMLSTVHLYPIDGAAGRVPAGSTAWGYRDAKWSAVILGADPEPANADLIRSWARDYWDAVHPFAASGGGAYVNFIQEESQDRVNASYGANYERLAKAKAAYDPDNVFHVNWNIRPAA